MPKEIPPKVVHDDDDTPPTGINITMEQINALIAKGDLAAARNLLETKKLIEQAIKDFQAKDEEAKSQIARLRAIEDEIAERQRQQDECSHRKEDGKPAIGGQRGHDNIPIWVCLNCNKLFIGNELPVHLRIRSDMVGGIGG